MGITVVSHFSHHNSYNKDEWSLPDRDSSWRSSELPLKSERKVCGSFHRTGIFFPSKPESNVNIASFLR
eukprot:UN12465